MSAINVILVSGEGGGTIWGVHLCFVDGNVQEYGGGTCGFPNTGDWSDSQVA